MSKTDNILDVISSALEKHFDGELKRNSTSLIVPTGSGRYMVRVWPKKTKSKVSASQTKRPAKKKAA